MTEARDPLIGPRPTKVAIVGCGVVGKAMQRLFPQAVTYDLAWGNKARVNECDVAFVCVPTPNREDGSLDASALWEVLDWLECPLIVIRSTVMPGTCDGEMMRRKRREQSGRIVYQPEYLGETVGHPFADMKQRPFLVIGGEPADRRALIELYQTVYSANVTIRQLTLREAEVAKLAENTAIAHKIAMAQELYDGCEAAGVDYYTIREVVFGDDPRQTLWHTFVYPQKRGMNSKCLPKDVYGFAAWLESLGVSASITRAILERNREWTSR